jgi:hypothetical protein
LGLLRCGFVDWALLSCCCAGHLVFMVATLAHAAMCGPDSDALVRPQVQCSSGWRFLAGMKAAASIIDVRAISKSRLSSSPSSPRQEGENANVIKWS